ncbi:hypothetical protein MAGR_20250 [Mycolicibacterium agri]|uniref:Uncharacterized protein n=1 Tax=Mycolicibacterium agri TaxID=36811 RepID=A0A7I9VYQ5_MYCAG|nr:hypothetical protein MAGR_20250 [Mycolicibacterium agri]
MASNADTAGRRKHMKYLWRLPYLGGSPTTGHQYGVQLYQRAAEVGDINEHVGRHA